MITGRRAARERLRLLCPHCRLLPGCGVFVLCPVALLSWAGLDGGVHARTAAGGGRGSSSKRVSCRGCKAVCDDGARRLGGTCSRYRRFRAHAGPLALELDRRSRTPALIGRCEPVPPRADGVTALVGAEPLSVELRRTTPEPSRMSGSIDSPASPLRGSTSHDQALGCSPADRGCHTGPSRARPQVKHKP